ncbi:MAG: hypothetical protein Q9157_000628 [Trypethelium eluteriae]
MQAMTLPAIAFLFLTIYSPISALASTIPGNMHSLRARSAEPTAQSTLIELAERDAYPDSEDEDYIQEKSSEWERRLVNVGDDASGGLSVASSSPSPQHHRPQSNTEIHTTYHQYSRPQSTEGYSHDNPKPEQQGSHKMHKHFKRPAYPDLSTQDVKPDGGAANGIKRSVQPQLSKRIVGAHANTETFPPPRAEANDRDRRREKWKQQDEEKRIARDMGEDLEPDEEDDKLAQSEDPGEKRLENKGSVKPDRAQWNPEHEDRKAEGGKDHIKVEEGQNKGLGDKERRFRDDSLWKRDGTVEQKSKPLSARMTPFGNGVEWKPVKQKETSRGREVREKRGKSKKNGFWHIWEA